MKTKKIALILVLSTSILFGAVGCSKPTENSNKSKQESTTQNTSKNSTENTKSTTKEDSDTSKKNGDDSSSKEKASSNSKLGDTYTGTKNIQDLKQYDKICDDFNKIPYVKGEYKELEFALDLLTAYFNGDVIAYDYMVSTEYNSSTGENDFVPINDKDKKNLEKALATTKIQLELKDGQGINIEPAKAEFIGPDLSTKTGVSFSLKINLYPEGNSEGYWNTVGVSVFEKDGKLTGHISGL